MAIKRSRKAEIIQPGRSGGALGERRRDIDSTKHILSTQAFRYHDKFMVAHFTERISYHIPNSFSRNTHQGGCYY